MEENERSVTRDCDSRRSQTVLCLRGDLKCSPPTERETNQKKTKKEEGRVGGKKKRGEKYEERGSEQWKQEAKYYRKEWRRRGVKWWEDACL